MHQIEAGQEKFTEASARLSALSAAIPSESAAGGRPPDKPGPGTSLVQADLRAYQEVLAREAKMSVAERIAEMVRTNLGHYVSSLLSTYHRENGEFPPSIEELARWAASGHWQINHIRSGGEKARRLFVVPGDDPDAVTTSYRVIESDPGAARWVVESPVLPDGRQYIVTYRYIDADDRVQADLKEAY
jgi:hypothetical protein